MTEVVDVTALEKLSLLRRGKVRDVYDLGDRLLLVATDRVSAFDHVLPTPIPDKGRVLTQLSRFWFDVTKGLVPNHLISTDLADFPREIQPEGAMLEGRSMLVKKTRPVEVECVVRGYISGAAWKEYENSGTVGRESFADGLAQFDRLPEPAFTPAVKRHEGHDENISFGELKEQIGGELANHLKDLSIGLYERGQSYVRGRGLILADTKFEFGWDRDRLILIDEVLTPDSSRFWLIGSYGPGREPESNDKQIVRDYLVSLGWDGTSPVPGLPEHVVTQVRVAYLDLHRRITGQELA